MLNVLEFSALLTLGIVGSLIIFGFLIKIVENTSNKLIYKKFGKAGLRATSILGTTIHEFGHFIMCKIFLHKVIEVKWFSFNMDTPELGHVSHSFNKRNIYQRIGNFFIGTAPLIVGSLIISIAYRLLLKNSFYALVANINLDKFINLGENFNSLHFIELLFSQFSYLISNLFTLQNLTSIGFWIFLIIAICISTHMTLSKADLKNSLDGIIFIFIICFIISLVLFVFQIPHALIISRLIILNVFLISFLSIGLFFSLITLLIAKLFSLL